MDDFFFFDWVLQFSYLFFLMVQAFWSYCFTLLYYSRLCLRNPFTEFTISAEKFLIPKDPFDCPHFVLVQWVQCFLQALRGH